MELGAEISQKIKKTIKKKLQAIGQYVDDELPEYIMVMIANKRTHEQVVDDLNLFLGEEATGFTKWLFTILRKLQKAMEIDNLLNAHTSGSSETQEADDDLVKKKKKGKKGKEESEEEDEDDQEKRRKKKAASGGKDGKSKDGKKKGKDESDSEDSQDTDEFERENERALQKENERRRREEEKQR